MDPQHPATLPNKFRKKPKKDESRRVKDLTAVGDAGWIKEDAIFIDSAWRIWLDPNAPIVPDEPHRQRVPPTCVRVDRIKEGLRVFFRSEKKIVNFWEKGTKDKYLGMTLAAEVTTSEE